MKIYEDFLNALVVAIYVVALGGKPKYLPFLSSNFFCLLLLYKICNMNCGAVSHLVVKPDLHWSSKLI